MSNKTIQQIKVSRQFLSDFELVTKHYGCSDDEIDWLKKQARKNYDLVRRSMEIMAGEIKNASQQAA